MPYINNVYVMFDFEDQVGDLKVFGASNGDVFTQEGQFGEIVHIGFVDPNLSVVERREQAVVLASGEKPKTGKKLKVKKPKTVKTAEDTGEGVVVTSPAAEE